jgi:preprotein translocase SecE subunit
MARDRQRAKARRRRAEGPPPKKRDKRQRDVDETSAAGPRDVDAEEPRLEGAAPAPDPLKDSSPYVDEAKHAEAGGEVPPPGEPVDAEPVDDWFEGDDDFERAPDEVEGDLLPAGAGSRANLDPAVAEEVHASGATVRTERRQRGRVFTFLGHVVDELRRVQWPNRRQVGQGTAVTLGFVVLAGGFLGLMDAIWKPVIEAIL